jgi:hypothetical protein
MDLSVKTNFIGELNVFSNSLYIGDLLTECYKEDQTPFKATIANGKFPVQLSLVQLKDENDLDQERICFARIVFLDKKASYWKGIEGFSVDTGLVCVSDISTARKFSKEDRKNKEKNNEQYLLSLLNTSFDLPENIRPGWQLGRLNFNNSLNNLFAFSSGWGDGSYSIFLGYDDDNNIVDLIIDFGIVIVSEKQKKFS